MIFNQDYAAYYDLLYKDKNYQAEVDYVHSIINQYKPEAKTLLDLGCGTGQHDILLTDLGYSVTGVDQSEDMISMARLKKSSADFIQGDIHDLVLDKQFDVVVALFHVMSYQTGDLDLKKAFQAVRRHLNPGGIFFFDCWYGPGVLHDPPVVRLKRIENDHYKIIRFAEPAHRIADKVVEVHYQILVINKNGNTVREFSEVHNMRYLNAQDIKSLMGSIGMAQKASLRWMSRDMPTERDWSACFVGQL
jgi:SAM-dependent methyltransferase